MAEIYALGLQTLAESTAFFIKSSRQALDPELSSSDEFVERVEDIQVLLLVLREAIDMVGDIEARPSVRAVFQRCEHRHEDLIEAMELHRTQVEVTANLMSVRHLGPDSLTVDVSCRAYEAFRSSVMLFHDLTVESRAERDRKLMIQALEELRNQNCSLMDLHSSQGNRGRTPTRPDTDLTEDPDLLKVAMEAFLQMEILRQMGEHEKSS